MILQAELRFCNDNGVTSFQCPCRNCHGGLRYTIQIIRQHLRQNFRDPFLMRCMVGPDLDGGWPIEGIWMNDCGDRVSRSHDINVPEESTGAPDQLDPYHDVQQQMFDAFDTGDRLREDNSTGSDNAAFEDDDAEDIDKLEELYRQASQPVYEGKHVSIVSAIIVDELLTYLSTVLLPTGNCLPSTHYEAKKLIRKLGLNYDKYMLVRAGVFCFEVNTEI
jgi:hypothetical protein